MTSRIAAIALGTVAIATSVLFACGGDPDAVSLPNPAESDASERTQDASVTTDGAADGAGDARVGVLAGPVAALGEEVSKRSPGSDIAIAVLDLKTREYASVNDGERHVSASAPKAIWVAAALDRAGIDAVAPYADPIFADSSNDAAGEAIDLAGGINAINVFYASRAGMVDSAMAQWSGRIATNSPRKMGSDNYFTAKDAVAFLDRLERGVLLDAGKSQKLESWMTLSPRSGFGGWLGSRLPARARASMLHKAGWLPPGCCGDDGEYNTLNEIGVIEVASGHRYAIAILARRGKDYAGKQAPWVERASCVVYRAVSGEDLDCAD